jgi:hypothetical protein
VNPVKQRILSTKEGSKGVSLGVGVSRRPIRCVVEALRPAGEGAHGGLSGALEASRLMGGREGMPITGVGAIRPSGRGFPEAHQWRRKQGGGED